MDRLSIITLAAAKAYANKKVEALEQVVRYIGVTTTEITDGSTTNPITIKGQSVTAVAGDTVFYNGTSYAWDGNAWQEVMNIAEIITAVEALGGKVHDILGDIAPEFNAASTYAVDDIVLYEDDLYIFTNAHTGAWDSSDVTVTSIAQLVDDLRAEIASTNGRVLALEAHVTQSGDVIDSDNHSLHIVGEAIETEKTATGNPITVTDALPYPAVSLSAEVNAIQDLHGYDKPWAGGAGKNKLNNTATTTTDGGVTFTVNSDGTVTANGTATETITFNLTNGFTPFPSGNYIINGGVNNNIRVYANPDRTQGYYSGSADSVAFNVSTELVARIQIESGTVCNNVLIKPMIRLSTESDPTFAPYSNICPISGRTAVVITRSDGDEISEDFTIQLGTTVYGGTLNATTGALTVTHAIKDFGDLTWIKSASGVAGRNRFISAAISDIKHSNNNYVMNSISSVGYENKSANAVYNDNIYQVVAVNADGELVVADEILNSGTADQFKTARTGQTICYELATPQTIQLTPTQLQMLKGYNRLSSDGGGDMTLTYRANKADSVQAEVDVLETTKADNADVVDYIENGNTASRAYSANQFMLWKGDLYKVTTSIASGATITAGTNVSKTTIGAVLTALLNA